MKKQSIAVVVVAILVALGIWHYLGQPTQVVDKTARTARGHLLTVTTTATISTAAVQDDDDKLVIGVSKIIDPKTNQPETRLNPDLKAGDAGTIYYLSNGKVNFQPDPK